MKSNNFKFINYPLFIFYILFLFPSFYGHSQIINNGPVYNDIQTQINIQFGPIYNIDLLHKMEGLVNKISPYPTPHRSLDPYGTLKDFFLFTAIGIPQSDYSIPKGFWGMYRDGQIVWQSDTIIPTEFNSELGKFATADLNNDGKVDVMISSTIPATVAGVQWLWIFSWDGMTGNLISEVNSEGQSTIVSMTNVADFEFADVNADGIWEIQGTWKDENGGGERLITYGWNGQQYGKWPGIPQPDEDAFLPRDAVDVKVQAIIAQDDSTLLYTYKLENQPTSIQDINEFNIDRKIDSVKIVSSIKGWKFFINGDLYRWKDFHSTTFSQKTNYLMKGQSSSDFKFESKGLPEISKYYVRGYNKIPIGQDVPLRAIYNDIFQNSVSGYTVVPSTLPDSLNAIDFLDSLIYYNEISDSIGWITNTSTSSKYNIYFGDTKFYLQQNDNPAAINVLDSVLTDVEADSGVTLTSEAYALIKYNTEYLKEQLTQPHGLPHNVRLLNSQGQLLTGGSLQYYNGGWKTTVNNGDGTFLVDTERSTVSLRMSYEGGNETRQNVPIQGEVVTFKTVNSKVELHNSQNQLIDQGSVKYYTGGWRDFGVTAGGVASKELLPLQYSFRMTYAYASIDKQQNIGQDSVVVFQTVAARVELRNSTGNLIDQGSVQYYAGAWREFGTTSGGVASMELLPKQYSFRMTYAYVSNDKQQDIGQDSVVVFQTVQARVELRNSQNALMPAPMGDEGTVKYYAGVWREFGATSGGIVTKELLPKQYSLRMTYAYASIDKQQDIGNNPVVSFATVLATVNVTGQQNQPLNGAQVSYYSGAWRTIGETVNGSIARELLPRTYTFRAAYQGTSADLQQDISQNSTVNIQLNITGP